MSFISIPTEQTTAITDLLLVLQALGMCWYLARVRTHRPFWTRLWLCIFSLFAGASFLGSIAHGFEMTPAMNAALWLPLYLVLGLIVALFAVAAVSHHWTDALAHRWLPVGVVVAMIFFLVTQLWSDSFLLFVVYEAVTMLVVLGLYVSCLLRADGRRGSGLLATGVFVGILAAIVDAQDKLRFTCIWTFDNHGAFHLVQMISLIFLSLGLHQTHLLFASCLPPDEIN